jgi:hypothetical protein
MAQAEEGKTYAIIENGKVHQKFTIVELPCWADRLEVIELEDPANVEEGDGYNSQTAVITKQDKTPKEKAEKKLIEAIDAAMLDPLLPASVEDVLSELKTYVKKVSK